MTITHPRTESAAARPRRKERVTPIYPLVIDDGAAAEPAASAVAEALRVSEEAAETALTEVRRLETTRRHAALALETDLRPMLLDETRRAELRADYARAADAVTRARAAHERAVSLAAALRLVIEASEVDAAARRDTAIAVLDLRRR